MTSKMTTGVINLNGTRSHFSQMSNETKNPTRFSVSMMFLFTLFICIGILASETSQAKSGGMCVLSGGMDRELRIENCGEGQVVHADGTIVLSKIVLGQFAKALEDWNKVEKLDFKKPFPLSFPSEKSASSLMYGPRLAYLLKTKDGFVARQIVFFDNGPDYFEESKARFVARDGKLGFIDEKLKTVIPARYDYATPMSGGLSVVCISEKKNPCALQQAAEEEHSTVVGGKWAVIDKKGKIVKGPGLEAHEAYRFAASKREGK